MTLHALRVGTQRGEGELLFTAYLLNNFLILLMDCPVNTINEYTIKSLSESLPFK